MIKNFVAILLLISLASHAVPGQDKKKTDEKRAAAIADSIRLKGGKDTSSVKKDALKAPVPLRARTYLSDDAEGSLIGRNTLYLTDYKSISDFFPHIPYGFTQSLGSAGLPDEVMLYGSGLGKVSYMDDGISINNRLFNSYDLTNFQSERIDSIEVYPAAKGFLFSPLNDYASVNFISRDRIKEKQYSRLRFYQGANREGFIDFIFNMPAARNLYFTGQVTNNSVRDRYKNSEAGGWRASARLRYNLSEKINLIGDYRHVFTETKLNGGLNGDSIKALYPGSWETYLYDEKLEDFVNFTNRGVKTLSNAFSIRMLADFIEGSRTDISAYFNTGLNEFRQNDTLDSAVPDAYPGMVSIHRNNRYTARGVLVKQDFHLGVFDLKILLNYENNRLDAPLLSSSKENDFFSAGAALSANLLDSTFRPSLFAKSLTYNSVNYPGMGADINFALNKKLFIYAGYSFFKKPYGVFEEAGLSVAGIGGEQEINVFEASLRFRSAGADIRAGYFAAANKNYAVPVIVSSSGGEEFRAGYFSTAERIVEGINLRGSYKFFKVLASFNFSAYFGKKEELVNTPPYTLDAGIYYVDTLFNRNLDLKAGFNFKYYGKQNFLFYDFERMASSQYLRTVSSSLRPVEKTADVFRIDLFVAGRVQESAIVYFTWENILNTNYFIIPYYPGMGRNIRFGISWEFLD